MEKVRLMKKGIRVILITVLALSLAGFLYTYIQPRYTGTIVGVGRVTSVTRSTRHGSRSYRVVPLQVKYLDGDEEQIVQVRYARPEGPLSVGQQIVIVRSFNGFIPYPFGGLRLFCGVVGGSILLFLLFLWIDRRKPGKDEAH